MSDWLDISIPLKNGLPPWPGDRPFAREITSEIGVGGAVYNGSVLAMSAHTGTHVDAPKHFVDGGAAINELDPDTLIGPAYLLDLTGAAGHINAGDLRGRVPEGTRRLLIKSANSRLHGDGLFHTDYAALTVDAAGWLAAQGVKLLGFDYYSIAPYDAPAEAHRAFLAAPGAIVLENIDLSQAGEGWVDLVCLPLPVAGGDGAPARAMIRRREAQP